MKNVSQQLQVLDKRKVIEADCGAHFVNSKLIQSSQLSKTVVRADEK